MTVFDRFFEAYKVHASAILTLDGTKSMSKCSWRNAAATVSSSRSHIHVYKRKHINSYFFSRITVTFTCDLFCCFS